MKLLITLLVSTFLLVGWTTQTGHWHAPESAKKIKNPITGSSSIKKGKSIFMARCVACHGKSGNGDTPAGKALTPHAANLTSSAVQAQTDGEIFWKISNGRGAMIKWEPILKETERWNLVNYIRTLKNK